MLGLPPVPCDICGSAAVSASKLRLAALGPGDHSCPSIVAAALGGAVASITSDTECSAAREACFVCCPRAFACGYAGDSVQSSGSPTRPRCADTVWIAQEKYREVRFVHSPIWGRGV